MRWLARRYEHAADADAAAALGEQRGHLAAALEKIAAKAGKAGESPALEKERSMHL